MKKIDITDIMETIKQKAKHQEYAENPPEFDPQDKLSKQIPSLAVHCDPRDNIVPVSYRNNLLGILIVFTKKILLTIFKLYGNALLHRQAQINYEIAKTLQLMNVTYKKKIEALEKDNALLKEKIDNPSQKKDKGPISS